MFQYLKCLNSVSLTFIANQIVGHILASTNVDPNREFDHTFRWKSFEDGFSEAKSSGKPVLLLVHKIWCPACQKLKAKMTKSVRMIELSNQFIMVKLEVSENGIGNQKRLQPDGKYVPRILFFTSDGQFIKEAYNRYQETSDEQRYFYSNPAHVIETMLLVLKNYSNQAPLQTPKPKQISSI